LAYGYALLAGISNGCLYIVSRKAVTSSVQVLSVSACIQVGLALWFLSFTPLLNDGSLTTPVAQPWEAALWLSMILVVTTVSTLAFSQGAKWIPAAMSAMVDTSTAMSSGYLVEALVFGQRLELIPLIGASMMLASVVIMTASRISAPALFPRGGAIFGTSASVVPQTVQGQPFVQIPSSPTSPIAQPSTSMLVSPDSSASASAVQLALSTGRADGVIEEGASAATDGEDLVSFIASEFVDREPQSRFPVRKRRHNVEEGAAAPTAHTFGAVAMSGAIVMTPVVAMA
jgi:multidrug transporter EmrE-like cation transporter